MTIREYFLISMMKLKLKGVGKYTAAAISSICFGGKNPAVDGNFYRVLSRLFADDFDISNSKAFSYFSELATLVMPENVVISIRL
jgi:A/G-specific adenine glycosylase